MKIFLVSRQYLNYPSVSPSHGMKINMNCFFVKKKKTFLKETKNMNCVVHALVFF